MDQQPNPRLWDSFWAAHASNENFLHLIIWRMRFLFSSAYARRMAGQTKNLKNAKLLEVGSGSARTLYYLNKYIPNSESFAIDLSPHAIRLLNKMSPSFRSAVANVYALPFTEAEFDVSFSIGLIEHFTRADAASIMQEKIRVTRPGGWVSVVVPWQNSIYNLIVRKAFGKYWPFGDENPFRRMEMKEFLNELNLQDVKVFVIYGTTLLGIGRKSGA